MTQDYGNTEYVLNADFSVYGSGWANQKEI